MERYLIKNGHVIDIENKLDDKLDILIEDGKVKEIGADLKVEGVIVIDAQNKVVTPGLVDMHVHLREPGREDKETIETAMKAALKGGITGVLAMPNTNPLTDNQTVIEYQLSSAKKLDLINLYVSGRITKEGRITEMWEMKQKGAVALTDDGEDVANEHLMRNALDWATTYGMPVLCHSEIPSLAEGQMNEGLVSVKLGLAGIPKSAENIAIAKNIMLAEETGAQIHISHVSTKKGVECIKKAKEKGIKVTAEATPHHIALTDEACLEWNTDAKINPPLREEEDRQAILKGLKEGVIEIIASDHAPHLASEKLLPFNDAPYGTVGLETLFGVINTYLIEKKILSVRDVIEKMTVNPAKILNITCPTIVKGQVANISVFDLSKEWTVDPQKFESKGKNSVFKGMKLKGMAEYVFSLGKLRVEKGELKV